MGLECVGPCNRVDVDAVLRAFQDQRPAEVTFYPYVSTKSTIRVRNGRLLIRLSDHMEDAGARVQEGVMAVLLGKLHGKVPAGLKHHVAAYQHWLNGENAESTRRSSRQSRGSKKINPIGDHRSLLESYLRVSMEMDLTIEAPKLSWSERPTRRRFGHHDPDHDCIVISRTLDDARVPEFVLDYVLYHELLHIVHPPRVGRTGKRVIHHKEFREAERRFPQQKEADGWLSKLAQAR